MKQLIRIEFTCPSKSRRIFTVYSGIASLISRFLTLYCEWSLELPGNTPIEIDYVIAVEKEGGTT